MLSHIRGYTSGHIVWSRDSSAERGGASFSGSSSLSREPSCQSSEVQARGVARSSSGILVNEGSWAWTGARPQRVPRRALRPAQLMGTSSSSSRMEATGSASKLGHMDGASTSTRAMRQLQQKPQMNKPAAAVVASATASGALPASHLCWHRSGTAFPVVPSAEVDRRCRPAVRPAAVAPAAAAAVVGAVAAARPVLKRPCTCSGSDVDIRCQLGPDRDTTDTCDGEYASSRPEGTEVPSAADGATSLSEQGCPEVSPATPPPSRLLSGPASWCNGGDNSPRTARLLRGRRAAKCSSRGGRVCECHHRAGGGGRWAARTMSASGGSTRTRPSKGHQLWHSGSSCCSRTSSISSGLRTARGSTTAGEAQCLPRGEDGHTVWDSSESLASTPRSVARCAAAAAHTLPCRGSQA